MNFFDLHCDTITKAYDGKINIYDGKCDINLIKAKDLSKWCQVFAIFVPDDLIGTCKGFDYFNNIYDYFKQQVLINNDIVLVKNKKDFLCDKDKFFILSIESATCLEGEIKNFYKVLDKGVKIITLTWNGENEIGYGSSKNGGLKDFGKVLLKEMEENNVIIDVSHCSDKTFEDVLKNTKKPLIASHSNSRNILNHKRNLTDDQFLEIKKRNGIVGINFYKHFLGEGESSFVQIFQHIEHFINLGGSKNIAIGSDFDGAHIRDDINSIDKIYNLKTFLKNRGLKDNILDDIFFNNAYKFLYNNI
ncbi:MAG: dipeptidase [Oscillospiraceae bacterium]